MIWVAFVWTGQGPYLRLWADISFNLTRCARSARSGLVPHNQDHVHSVASTFSRIWADMYLLPHGLGTAVAVPGDLVYRQAKAENWALWFPPWTVSREYWTNIMRSDISGIAVDTLLFSHIGVPLFHQYRVFSQSGTHAAFRGSYMQRIRTILEDSDAASLRTRHRRRAWEIAARMSRTSLQEAGDREPDSSSRPSTSRQSGPRGRKSTPAAAAAVPSVTSGSVRSHRSSQRSIPSLMDLALPKFADPEGQLARPHLMWIVMTDSPESPAPIRLRAPLRSPSPCLNLDILSSDESAGPGDISDVPICISDASNTPSNLTQVLSDDYLPTAGRTVDQQQDIRICDVPLEVQIVDLRISVAPSAEQMVEQQLLVPSDDSQWIIRVVDLPPEVRISDLPLGVGAVDLAPVVRAVDLPLVGFVKTVMPATPPDSALMSPSSPLVSALEDSAVSSVPMSPNRVRSESSQNIRDEGPVFEVSPDTSGFLMRPSGAAGQAPVMTQCSENRWLLPLVHHILFIHSPLDWHYCRDSLRFRQLWRRQCLLE